MEILEMIAGVPWMRSRCARDCLFLEASVPLCVLNQSFYGIGRSVGVIWQHSRVRRKPCECFHIPLWSRVCAGVAQHSKQQNSVCIIYIEKKLNGRPTHKHIQLKILAANILPKEKVCMRRRQWPRAARTLGSIGSSGTSWFCNISRAGGMHQRPLRPQATR